MARVLRKIPHNGVLSGNETEQFEGNVLQRARVYPNKVIRQSIVDVAEALSLQLP